MEGSCRRSSETEAKADITMTISVTEEATTSSAGDNRACSNRRGREDECGGSEGVGTGDGDSNKKGPLCYRSRSRKELLCLQRV